MKRIERLRNVLRLTCLLVRHRRMERAAAGEEVEGISEETLAEARAQAVGQGGWVCTGVPPVPPFFFFPARKNLYPIYIISTSPAQSDESEMNELLRAGWRELLCLVSLGVRRRRRRGYKLS